MASQRIEEWLCTEPGTFARRSSAGVVYRRVAPPPPPGIISQSLESLSVVSTLGTNPAGVAAFREVVKDPTYGYIQAQHDHMAIVDNGGAEGKSVRTRYDDGWYQSATNNGIAYAPVLPRKVEAARVTFRARFNSGFISGKGGKFGPGLGWKNDQVNSPSTGGTSNNHAGSFRMMWRDSFRVSPYLYDANGTAGIGLATSPTVYTPSDNAWHDYEFDVILNTATVVAGPAGTTPPSPGTEGVEYLADGTLAVRVDGSTIYSATNRVLRKYADTLLTHLTWSWFRGGGDTTWDVTGGPCYIDLASYTVIEL